MNHEMKATMSMDVKKFIEGAGSAKKELRELSRDLANTRSAYNQLSQAEKNSDFGRALANQMAEMTGRAGQLRDAIDDVNAEIKNMASDTRMFNTMASSVQGVVAVAQTLSSAMGLADGNADKFQKTLLKLAQMQSVINGMKTLQEVIQPQSPMMIAMRKLPALFTELKTALTGAKNAQMAFNAVCDSNVYVALASVILTTVMAIKAFADGEEDVVDQAEKAREAQENYNNAQRQMVAGMGEALSKFAVLTAQYKELKSVAEKTQWIKANQTAFNDLGITIDGVNDSEKAFSDANEKMVRAFTLRIRLANLYKRAAEQMQKAEDERAVTQTTSNSLSNGRYNLNDLAGQKTVSDIIDVQKELDALYKELGLFDQKVKDISTTAKNAEPIWKSLEIPQARGLIENLQREIKKWEERKVKATNIIEISDAQKQIDTLKNQLQKLEQIGKLKIGIELDIDGSADILKQETEKLLNQYQAETNKKVDGIHKQADAYGYYNQMINAVSSSLSQLTQDESAQMAQFALNTSAMMIDAVKTIAMFQAQAIASGTASGAKLPFPANIGAIATILSTVAGIFASLPKFEDGGIVGGLFTTGDRQLVRANKGEMILNQREQKNLFNLLQNGGAYTAQQLQILLKLRGTDLIGLINNSNNKYDKI